jgi:hypothetical protein
MITAVMATFWEMTILRPGRKSAAIGLQARTPRFGLSTDWFQDVADDIIANGVKGSLCLCHGALGQLEF